MDDLKNTENIVRTILQDNPDARNSDNILYEAYISKVNPFVLIRPVRDYLLYFADLGIARFETISRIRRKLQETEENLRGVEQVQKWRKENEKEFRAYARGENK